MDTVKEESLKLQKDISTRIRLLRKEKGWSLEKLADMAGFSKGYMSLIENCEKNPTISTLTKIAHCLDVQIGFLITGHETKEKNDAYSLVRANECKVFNNPYAPPGYIYETMINNSKDRLLDAYVITIGPKMPKEPRQHEGEEMVYILRGRQEFIYDGEVMVLEPGDCLYIDSSKPHNARILDGEKGKFLMVVPRKRG
jgi:transcriptional regulator with XRE-family HTH domain